MFIQERVLFILLAEVQESDLLEPVEIRSLKEVFGVSKDPVLSYYQRSSVDTSFTTALNEDKQIVVYGASKQGKTALVSRHLSPSQSIVVQLSPKAEVEDIYKTVLHEAGVQVTESAGLIRGTESSATGKLGFKAQIPALGAIEAGIEAGGKKTLGRNESYKEIPLNLSLPNDVAMLLRQVGNKKAIVLENFHYLNDDMQKQLAFDLRTFQELGVRFVILGVWREKNRLSQFNGDLLDRVHEIPVEPWYKDDFENVAVRGQAALNIKFGANVLEACKEASFQSIGVFQELLKQTCVAAGISETQTVLRVVDRIEYFDTAKSTKAQDYGARHERALESIASGAKTGGHKGEIPLFLPYYLIRVICEAGYDGLSNGMRRSVIQERIQAIHHRPDDVRASDMSNLLYNLAAAQASKGITPPIIDYDQSQKLLQVVDSTFYFFLKNSDLKSFVEQLYNPHGDYRRQQSSE